MLVALAGAGALVAVVGFMDDHKHIPARWRLLGHFSAAIWALFWIGGLPPLIVFGAGVDLGLSGHILAAVYLVWMLNLYNFMDGIDGVASVEAICVCLSACLLYWLGNVDSMIWLPLTLAVSVAGFLFWNFPPARIFHGRRWERFSRGCAWHYFSASCVVFFTAILGLVDFARRLYRRRNVYIGSSHVQGR